MSPELVTFVFEALNFGILVAVLGWLVFKPIRKALDAERDARAKADEQLEQRRKEVAAKEERIKSAEEKLEEELEDRRREALEKARKEAADILHKAREQAEDERGTVHAELMQMRKAQISEAAETAGEISGASVRLLLESLEAPSLDSALVKAACRELGRLNGAKLGDVTVEAARELDAESRTALDEALGVDYEVRVLPELGAGVRVTTAAGQVDATAQSFARDAEKKVAGALNARGVEDE